jgi:glycosyltransferase involved in cell wall biosynthesis
MSVTAVLHLAPLTRSIAFRPYLAELDGQPILARLAKQFLVDSGADRLLVLTHYASEWGALTAALAGTGAELRLTKQYSELQATAEIVSELDSDQIAFCQLGCALAPAGLLCRMVRHHCEHKNSFTILDGTPVRCGLVLLEKDSFKNLLQIADQFGFSIAEDALRRLQLLGDRVAGRIPLAMNSAPFNLAAAYNIAPESLPAEAPLDREAERVLLENAIRAARSLKADPDSMAVFDALKQLQTERQEKALVLPRAGTLASEPRSSAKKRVLIVSLPSAFSGAEQALCSMIHFLDSERFEPYAITVHQGVFAEKLREAGAEVTCPDWETSGPNVENFAYALQLFRRIQPNLIHFNGSATVPFLSAAMAMNIPVVQHIRNADLRGFYDGIVQAKAIIAITDYLKRETMHFPIPTERIRVIYDEVDSERLNPALFSQEECRRELGLDQKARIALMIARIAPNKRYDLMLDAAARIRTRVPDFQLVLKGDVYGDSLLMHELRAQAKKLGIEDVIRWMDFVPDIRTLMSAADALVLCSDREGLGSCVVEALSMKLPVVVTNTGGTHEVVESGVSGGFVVPGSDPEALAARVSELLNDAALRERLGNAGREFAQTHLDARISAKAVMEVYDQVLADTAK